MLSRAYATRLPAMAPSSSASRVGAVLGHFSSRSMASSSAGAQDVILFESHLSSRTYILNRDKKLNALDQTMLDILRPKIEEWASADLCKLVIGRGNGRAFCAGGDVASVVTQAANPSTRTRAIEFFKREFELDYLLAALGKPYVAVMDGITMGGGAGLCMQAPFRIATEKTMFAMPETKIGYCPDVGASAFLARLDGELGTYLALTSEIISGREVYELGLATHFVPSTSLPALLRALQALEEPSWEAVDATIEGFYIAPEELGVGGDFEGQVNKEQAEGVPPSERYARAQGGQPQTQAPGQSSVLALPTGPHSGAVRAAIDRAFSRPSVAGILHELAYLAEHGLALPSASNAEAEKEQVKKWAGRVMGVLGMRSPTSLVVSLEAQRRGREAVRGEPASALERALRMELGIATAFVNGASPDFSTGVRAVLIDKLPKDQRPAWEPSTVDAVPVDDILEKFFNPSSPYYKPASRLEIPESFAARPINNPNQFALPSEQEIESVIKGSHRTSGDFGLTVEEVVAKCERDLAPGSRKSRRTKGGIREKVADIVRRKCDVDAEGKWVKWRG